MKRIAAMLALIWTLLPFAPALSEMVPSPSPSPMAAADFLNELLPAQAEKTNDPWVKAILMSGPLDIAYEDGEIRFALRAFDPKLSELGDREADVAGYLDRLIENASAYDLNCLLPVTSEGGVFSASDKDVKALIKSVGKAAAAAQKAFNDKNVRMALSEYLLDADTASDMGYGEAAEMAPLFAAQVKQSLSVKEGPFALKLTATGADGEALVDKGYQAALQRLSMVEAANQMTDEEIEAAFLEDLNAQASAVQKKGAVATAFILDIDSLPGDAGDAYEAYLSAYEDAYAARLADLIYKVQAMPDYPALAFPKSGRIEGSKSGTKVIFKAPKDGVGRFVQMRGVESDEAVVSAFLQPGGSTSVRVPKGMYTILIASGEIWYGPKHLFGDNGSYQRTEQVEILGSNYYHTFTLGGVTDGNTSAYGADPSV